MMKRLIAALLLLFAVAANAQICTAQPSTLPVLTGGNSSGWWAAQWHPCAEGGFGVSVFSVLPKGAPVPAPSASGSGAVLMAAWLATSIDDPAVTAMSAADRASILAAKPPVQLPPSQWAVAKFSTLSTRPAYPVSNGVRSATSTARATVGATCDCTAPIVEGLTTYCPYQGSSGLVTVCTKP